ncbi:nitroreductase family protein [Nesterenkonia populi]
MTEQPLRRCQGTPAPRETAAAVEQRTPAERLHARYGREADWQPPEWNETLDVLLRHRSVRRYLDQEVSDETVRTVIAAAQSASTSSNQQIISALVIRDQHKKDAVAEIGGPFQKHIRHAPALIIWLVDFRRARHLADAAGREPVGLDYLDIALVGACDAGIHAQNALVAAESLGLGGVFLGSVRNDSGQLAQVLELPQDVIPFVGMELGHPDPQEEAGIKPRLPQESFLHFETYDADAVPEQLAAYEATLAEYYRDYDMDPSWGRRLVSRLGEKATFATQRHKLADFLRSRGLGLK